MNNDYISRDAVVDGLNKLCDRVCQYSKTQRYVMCSSCPLGDAFIVIEDDIPDADVRAVVLCRDCRYYNHGWCYNPNTYDDEKTRGNTSPEWFCADGKRREADYD